VRTPTVATRYATKQEAEEAAHTLSHQPWMPSCSWKVIERQDGSAYVHGSMDPGIPEGEDREQLDALRHYLGGQFRAATASGPRSWHGRYGKAEICVMMPWRTRSRSSVSSQRNRSKPPEMVPCREAELREENARLRKALAAVREYAESRCTEEHANFASASWVLHLIEDPTTEK
jgi:hypothetical protein